MSKKRKILSYILIFIILATVCYIFSNSSLGKEDSSKTSNGVYASCKEFVADVFGEDFSLSVFSVITHNVFRKLAHFFEYFVLGLEVSILYICLKLDKSDLLLLLFFYAFGLIVASSDETFQIFTNRGPSVIDVLIDYSGYLFALIIVLSIFFIVRNKKNKKKF